MEWKNLYNSPFFNKARTKNKKIVCVNRPELIAQYQALIDTGIPDIFKKSFVRHFSSPVPVKAYLKKKQEREPLLSPFEKLENHMIACENAKRIASTEEEKGKIEALQKMPFDVFEGVIRKNKWMAGAF